MNVLEKPLTGTRSRLVLSAVLLAVPATFGAGRIAAEQPGRAALLYENHCVACHESTVHVRAKRAQKREELQAWVVRWARVLDLTWTRTDIDDVTDFLAKTYYDDFEDTGR